MLSQDAFKNLDPARKEMFMQLAEKLDGKTVSEGLPIIMSGMKNMPPGPELSVEEKNAMMEAVLSSMPEDEAVKLRKLMKMMGMP